MKSATQEQINNNQMCCSCKHYSSNSEPYYEMCNKFGQVILASFICDEFEREDYNLQFSDKVLNSKLFKHNRKTK